MVFILVLIVIVTAVYHFCDLDADYLDYLRAKEKENAKKKKATKSYRR